MLILNMDAAFLLRLLKVKAKQARTGSPSGPVLFSAFLTSPGR